MSSQNTNHAQPTADTSAAPAAASNRAARRAQRKGKAPSEQPVTSRKGNQLRDSQVLAQPRFKGRRGDR